MLALFDLAARLINKTCKLFGLSLDCRFSTAYAVVVGAYLSVRLFFVRGDTLLAIAGSNLIAYLRTKKNIIYVSDATFRSICVLNPEFGTFPKWLRAQGDRNEAKSLSKARFVVYSSQWASSEARSHYNVPEQRIFELPFGPNIPDSSISQYFTPKSINRTEVIRIMFASTDWKGKSGDKVLTVCRLLIAAGVTVRLLTIGNIPDYANRHDFVENKGFLDKSDPEQLAQLCEAYKSAHFLLLPTSIDTFGIVFSEAQAFGVPSITCDVGGIGSAVIHGKTGLLLPADAPAEAFVEAILQYVRDPKLYDDISRACRKRYLEQANWGKWSTLIVQLAQAGVENVGAAGSPSKIVTPL